MSTLYEVSSLIALVMNKPNMFSQVLGILNKGDQIDVINISKSWAYFKYNNINAYVKKGNLKILNTEPIESKGSVTLKYIDITTNNEIYPSETINNLNLGKYSYEARVIYNYKLQSNSTQSVNLTEEDPDQVIIFYYNKILGSITIKYIDKNVNTDIYEPKVIENLSLGTYTYGAINISGYVLSDNEIKTVTITETSPNATITFKYAEILGTVTIRYIDNSSSSELSEADTFTDLKLGTYSYNYKNIPGYSLANDSTQTVELTDDNHDVEIEFKYNELLGSITIKYIDSSSLNEIETANVISNLSLGTYSYSAKSFEGYEIIGDSSQSVTLNDSNLNAIISFNYSRISGSITIEYLDSSTLSEISSSTIINNIALGSYIYDAIYIDNYEIDGDSSISIVLTVSNPNQTISFKYNKIEIPDDLNWNEVPYISTYYIKPIVKPGEEVFIDYYITDYYQKEYIEEDYSETFTVTVKIEGQNDKLYHYLKAGDHKVSLGSFNNEEEQKFSILCTDKYGRNSHELFNFFLVQNDIEVKEYIMTEDDLVTYNIKNTDDYEEKVYVKVDKLIDSTTDTKIEEIANSTIVPSHKYICFIGTTKEDENGNPMMQTTPAKFWLNTIVKYADDYDKDAVLMESTNTRIGLQKLLDDKKLEGYNKLLLLTGTYRIDHQQQIYIPTEFTLDMNNSTLKQNQFTGNSSLMISLDATFDSHVINGNIEGDYFSHDYANSSNNSEWCMGVSIAGPCKYSSFENITIKNITGYGGGNGISQKSGYTYFSKSLSNAFKLGDISIIDGSNLSSTKRQSTNFIDISNYVKYDYIAINRYLGYQGMLGGSWNLILHFYDINKKYIKSISTFQYRRTRIPLNSYFIKVTILSSIASNDFWIVYFKVPCHCSFTNIEFYNCRCVGLAQGATNDMFVNNCKFNLNGQSGAFCAYDAEDGWDQMQDVTIKNCKFLNNYRNDFLTCSGHNFVVENMVKGKIYFWPRTNSYVVRNCNNLNDVNLGRSSRQLTGYVRFYNNKIINNIKITGDNDYDWSLSVKNCTINGKTESVSTKDFYFNCSIGGNLNSTDSLSNAIGRAKFISCFIFNRTTSHNYGGNYYNCIIENISGSLQNTHNYYNCKFTNLKVTPVDNSNINIYNCTLTNSYLTLNYWQKGAHILISNCQITNNDYLIKLPHYSIKKSITIDSNIFNSLGKNGMIYFYDDRTSGSVGDFIVQKLVTIINNNITLINSSYVIIGLSNTTVNNINIKYINNIITPDTVLLCNPSAYNNSNISISKN